MMFQFVRRLLENERKSKHPIGNKDVISLDKSNRAWIMSFLKRLEITDNPRAIGKALQGNLSGYWRYRVGDYRLLCQIKDNALIILVVEIGHRADIYR